MIGRTRRIRTASRLDRNVERIIAMVTADGHLRQKKNPHCFCILTFIFLNKNGEMNKFCQLKLSDESHELFPKMVGAAFNVKTQNGKQESVANSHIRV